jgi:hypothetical protein
MIYIFVLVFILKPDKNLNEEDELVEVDGTVIYEQNEDMENQIESADQILNEFEIEEENDKIE